MAKPLLKIIKISNSVYFDYEWYVKNNNLPLKNKYFAKLHYFLVGFRNNFDPSPLFNSEWYDHQRKELSISNSERAILHYLKDGWRRELDPHPLFSTRWYLKYYIDVRHANIEPLRHYLKYGIKENRCAAGWFIASEALTIHSNCVTPQEVLRLCFSELPLGSIEGRLNMDSPLRIVQAER